MMMRALARDVLSRGRIRRSSSRAWIVRLAVALLGPDAVAVDPELLGEGYLRGCSDGACQIVISPNVDDVQFVIAHEIGHWAFRTLRPELAWPRVEHASEERNANLFAEALLGRKERRAKEAA